MSWNTNSPDGTKSVKANNAILQANTTYTETEMNKDHFWNIGSDEDGRHKFAQMPKYTGGAVATPTSPTIGAGMDLAYFSRLKTAAEATAAQDVQPYARNANSIMQLLGIRACGVFNSAGTLSYSHNCTLTRNGEGRFTINFTTALPTVNYAFLGSGIAKTSTTNDVLSCEVEAATSLAGIKTVNFLKIRTILTTGSSSSTRATKDPLQAFFVIFGG